MSDLVTLLGQLGIGPAVAIVGCYAHHASRNGKILRRLVAIGEAVCLRFGIGDEELDKLEAKVEADNPDTTLDAAKVALKVIEGGRKGGVA